MSSNTKERTSDDEDGKDIEEQKIKAKTQEAWKANEEYILPENNMPLVHLLSNEPSYGRISCSLVRNRCSVV